MIVIRKSQFGMLRNAAVRGFDAEMVRHLRSLCPRLTAEAGGSDLLRVAAAGRERAARHGFTQRGPVRLFLELMALLGCGFDDDPLLPWASAILADTAPAPMARADRLFQAASSWCDAAGTVGDRHDEAATTRFAERARALSPERFEPLLLVALEELHPVRAERPGGEALRRLIRHSVAEARRLGLRGAGCAGLLAGLHVLHGHRCTDDPLLPWIGRAVTEAAAHPGEAAFVRLAGVLCGQDSLAEALP